MSVTLALALAAAVVPIHGQTSADLFSSSVLQRIDINLNSADWAKLKQSFQANEYYPADLVWNGQTVRNVGIRSRGTGSRSGTKPGLRVDFGRYASSQLFVGLKAVILRNQTQDASAIHETAAMWFYEKMGIPAPRTSDARVYVNGEYAGLYVIVEEIDKKMLARAFGVVDQDTQNDGYLYEYNWIDEWRFGYLGSALDGYKARFSAKTHEKKPDEDLFRPIETLVRLTNETPASGLAAAIGERLDLPAFIRYLATQTFLAENDGFAGNWGINNFFFYRLENQAKHVFIAWDASETFVTPRAELQSRFEATVLVSKLMEIPEYREMYFATLSEAAAMAAEVLPGSDGLGALDAEIRRELDLIDGAVRDDRLKPFSNADFDQAKDTMRGFAAERIAYVNCEVSRLTGKSSNGC